MNTPIALIISSIVIAAAIYCATPHYQVLPVATSSNPAVWKIDTRSGEVALCATATGKDTESGCTKPMKQF